ncbi:phage Gp37/Gp68 family protein [Actinomadura litoris]|nr:phage Gp37/Gp68 family protein [Actinomadura litoris]
MTTIEWTQRTWNPTTGCDRLSPGCDSCYALTMARRLKAMGNLKYQRDGDPRTSGPGFGVSAHEDVLGLPLRWRKPTRIFVNSMSDLFHDGVPDEFVAQVFAVMAATPHHTFQLLTKRHGRMRSLLSRGSLGTEGFPDMVEEAMAEFTHASLDHWPLRNVWLGVSVEDQKRADLRIPALLQTPAAVRFLSAEPLLGPIDLRHAVRTMGSERGHGLTASYAHAGGCCERRLHGIDWVITGGESGPRARPADPNWFRSLRDQCQAADVAYLHKQNGEWAPTGQVGLGCIDDRERLAGPPDEHGFREVIRRVGKKAAGRELDGRTWDQYPTRRDDLHKHATS